jgi:photosystem II stability/assembly factor-like uncharacterized protein
MNGRMIGYGVKEGENMLEQRITKSLLILLLAMIITPIIPVYSQWESAFAPIDPGSLVKIAFFGNHGWAGSKKGVLLKTDDGGDSWQEIAKFQTIWDFHFINEKEGWLAESELWRTNDSGRTWTPLLSELDAKDVPWIGNVEQPNTLHQIHFFDSNNGIGIFEIWLPGGGSWFIAEVVLANTKDGGEHWAAKKWTEIMKLSNGRFPIDVIGNSCWTLIRGLWFSPDKGETWSDLPIPEGIPTFDFLNKNDGWSADVYGQCFRTRDGGKTWERISKQLPGSFTSTLFFISQQKGWLLIFPFLDDRIYHAELLETKDGGINWKKVSLPVDSQSMENDPRGIPHYIGGFSLDDVNDNLWIYLRNFSQSLFRDRNIKVPVNFLDKIVITWGELKNR